MNEVKEILEDRASDYGSFSNVAKITQDIVKALENGASWKTREASFQVAFYMIANKMARAVNGALTRDTILDIQGYAQLILDNCDFKQEGRRKNES